MNTDLDLTTAFAVTPDDLDRLHDRFVATATADGFVDVTYRTVDSPIGSLLLATTDTGLVRVAFAGEDHERVLQQLADRVSPRVLRHPARLDDTAHQLDEYFAGRRHAFDLAIDWELTHGFTRRVLQSTARIPFGELGTYRSVATRAGNAAAVRAAGNALGANPMPIVVPCHRIVRTGGALGGYTGGVQRKEFLLTLEGTLPR